MSVLQAPERFAGGPVVASVKVADDPTEHPHKHVIIVFDGDRAFSVHVVTFDGRQWTSGQGRYDLPWSVAIDQLAKLAKHFMRPEMDGV